MIYPLHKYYPNCIVVETEAKRVLGILPKVILPMSGGGMWFQTHAL